MLMFINYLKYHDKNIYIYIYRYKIIIIIIITIIIIIIIKLVIYPIIMKKMISKQIIKIMER